MKPGQLFIHKKYDFIVKYCSVTFDNKIELDYWEHQTEAVGALMFVKSLDLSKETRTTMPQHPSPDLAVTTNWESARKEFKKTGKISGGLFLNGDGRKIWISHYDFDCFLKKVV